MKQTPTTSLSRTYTNKEHNVTYIVTISKITYNTKTKNYEGSISWIPQNYPSSE